MVKVIIGILILFLVFGHTDPVEVTKQIIGISTKSLEKEQPGGESKVFDCNYNFCYEETLEVLKEMGVYVFLENKKEHSIIAMNFDKIFKKCINTTEVGIFFKEMENEQTKIDVTCANPNLVKFASEEIFSRLKKKL
ncbi:MAG: hypothetical protein U9R03_01580 [Candidatus Aerophobetes bacterium]|nr:hypothetical protein [Candidatus Aerophobetes bacterium]